MRADAAGAVLFEGDETVDPARADLLAAALGSGTAGRTALLVPFFGPTVGGERTIVDPIGLGLDLSRALLGGVSYEWARPFVAGETTHVRVTVEKVFTKGGNTFGLVAAEFTDPGGNLIQRQKATFIERADRA